MAIPESIKDMHIKWSFFQKTLKDHPLDFPEVIARIQSFLQPVFNALVNRLPYAGTWSAEHHRWV